MKMNMMDAIAASMGQYGSEEFIADLNQTAEKVASVDYFNSFDAGVEKTAGVYIDNPTIDNIEHFLTKYMLNELSFFPRTLEVGVTVIPSEVDEKGSGRISEASGAISVKIRHKVLDVPFIIKDGELLPFDVLQMDGQRVPYTRDNLKKIVINTDELAKKEEEGSSQNELASPYEEVADRVTPATVHGFAGDVLAIRDAQARRGINGKYVVASSEYEGFEKIAGLTVKSDKPNTGNSSFQQAAKKISNTSSKEIAKDILKTLKARGMIAGGTMALLGTIQTWVDWARNNPQAAKELKRDMKLMANGTAKQIVALLAATAMGTTLAMTAIKGIANLIVNKNNANNGLAPKKASEELDELVKQAELSKDDKEDLLGILGYDGPDAKPRTDKDAEEEIKKNEEDLKKIHSK